MTIFIFDCSNSAARPQNRGFGGPVENDVVSQLKSAAPGFGVEFVSTIEKATVLFTNDAFTEKEAKSNLPKLKRMDGVFFQSGLSGRNDPLNRAAEIADHVIYISEFSRQAHRRLYGHTPKSSSVALNAADPSVFTPSIAKGPSRPITWVASATDWNRPEKRFDAICKIARADERMLLIGAPPKTPLPKNMTSLGYVQSQREMAQIMRKADAMACMAFRDAAPKTVAQGLSCGLPVLFANSGGLPELVSNAGVSVGEPDAHSFYDSIPPMDDLAIELASERFRSDISTLRDLTVNAAPSFETMIGHYIKWIKAIALRENG